MPTSFKTILLFAAILGYFNVSIEAQSIATDDYSAEADSCIRLPPKPKRTAVEGENETNIVEFLNGGSLAFMADSEDPPDNVTLIMGNTGCGKTTLTQILASNLSRLHAVLTHGGELVIIDDDDRIGAPTMVSRTLVPELVIAIDDNTTNYYDCPGFDDTRGPQQDLAANMFMNQIPTMVKGVKMLFLVKHSSVQLGKDRLNFDLLAQHVTKFVKNLAQFEDSIGLVVTKVNSYSFNGKFIKDKQLLKSIVEFLTVYNETLHEGLYVDIPVEKRMDILKKIEFVNILLQRDSSGQYSRIAFSRTPEECGPLSNSEVVKKTKVMVTGLLNGLEYSPVGDPKTNFGYTLKDKTVINIHVYTKQINDAITEKVTEVVANYTQTREPHWNEMSQNKDSLSAITQEMEKSLTELAHLLENSSEEPAELATALKEGFQKLGCPVPEEMEKSLIQQENYLNFFDEATGTKVDRYVEAWHTPILQLKQGLEAYRDWYSFVSEVKAVVESEQFHSNKPPVPPNRDVDWMEYITRHNVLTVPDRISNLWKTFNADPTLVSKHTKILEDIMWWALEPVKISCSSHGSALVTGNFVRFGDFLDVRGQMKGENCTGSLPTLHVYAADTVFIDESVNAAGKKLNLVMVAPQWKVVGSPHFNLNGANAPDISPRKAVSAGAVGIPGKPGGSGGNFLGVAKKISRADKLTISVNGGDGGRGQDGGDGRLGRDGGHYLAEGSKYITLIYNNLPSGSKGEQGETGGNGGNGGAGGYGGNPGTIRLFAPLDSIAEINKQISRGNMGSSGIGGDGGKGGHGSQNNACRDHNILGFIPLPRYCRDTNQNPDGYTGSGGSEGGNSHGRELPAKSRFVEGVSVAKNTFQTLFANSNNKVTNDFIATF